MSEHSLPPESEPIPSSRPNRRRFSALLIRGALLGGAVYGGKHLFDRREQWLPKNPPLVRDRKGRALPQQPLPGEADYAEFLAGLNLHYIAPHEILNAHRRERNGVKNGLPPRHLWHAITPTLRAADELRHRLGVKLLYIASAYRSPEYNRQCPGAAKKSYHLKNRALDLVYDCPPSHSMREAKRMRSEGKFSGGLGEYSTFIHLDTRGYNATWDQS